MNMEYISEGVDTQDVPAETGIENVNDIPSALNADLEAYLAELCGDFDGMAKYDIENTEDVTEGLDAKRIREYGVEETIFGVREVFSQEVLRDWGELSMEERAEKFRDVAKVASKALGIDEVEVVFEPIRGGEGEIIFGYNQGDGKIHIHTMFLENPQLFVNGIDTVVHETRHQFQMDALRNPEKFGLDEKTWREWTIAKATYPHDGIAQYDPVGYTYNPLENDSVGFGRSVAREIVSDYNEMLHGNNLDHELANA